VGRNGSTVLHAAAGAYNTSRTPAEISQIFEYLLKKFPYVEHLESKEVTSGFTPLMIAVLGNEIEATKALLAAGASLDTKCLAGFSLRNAQLLAKMVVASSDGLIPGLDFDEAHGGKAWMEMMKMLLEASMRPTVEPKAKPTISEEDVSRHRIDRFVELTRATKLQFFGCQLGDGIDEVEILPVNDPDQSLVLKETVGKRSTS
jgi:hypothetical protein